MYKYISNIFHSMHLLNIALYNSTCRHVYICMYVCMRMYYMHARMIFIFLSFRPFKRIFHCLFLPKISIFPKRQLPFIHRRPYMYACTYTYIHINIMYIEIYICTTIYKSHINQLDVHEYAF